MKKLFCQLFLELVVVVPVLITVYVCFCFYIFIWFVVFPCLSILFLIFLFHMCSSQRCDSKALPHSLVTWSHWLAASRKQCFHRKQKAPFVLIWPWFYKALEALGFVQLFSSHAMLRPTYSAWFLKEILLLLYLTLFAVSIGFNAWPLCRRSLIILLFLPWWKRPKKFWANRRQRKSPSPVKCWKRL